MVIPGQVRKSYKVRLAKNEEIFYEYSTEDTVGCANKLDTQNKSSLQ